MQMSRTSRYKHRFETNFRCVFDNYTWDKSLSTGGCCRKYRTLISAFPAAARGSPCRPPWRCRDWRRLQLFSRWCGPGCCRWPCIVFSSYNLLILPRSNNLLQNQRSASFSFRSTLTCKIRELCEWLTLRIALWMIYVCGFSMFGTYCAETL